MTAKPYTGVAAHVQDELRRAWLRVEYQVRTGWRGEAPLAENVRVPDVIGPMDMGALFAAARGIPTGDTSGTDELLGQWLAAHERVEARIRATIEEDVSSPLVDLIRTFGLSPRQWATLMFALLPDVDPNLVHGYRYLARDPACSGLEGRLLAQLVYDTPEARFAMARDLSPSSPLVRYRLIDIAAPRSRSDALMFRQIRAAGRIAYLVSGEHALDPALAGVAVLRPLLASAGAFPREAVERATSALGSDKVVLVVQGPRGVGKRLLLQRAAAHDRRRLLMISAARLAQRSLAEQEATVRALVRELILLRAVPAFVDIDDAMTDADRDALPACFGLLLEAWNGPIALTIAGERLPQIPHRPVVHVRLDVPPPPIRAEMWRQAVPSLSAQDAESLAGRFAIPGGVILAAAHAAEASRMPKAGPPTAANLGDRRRRWSGRPAMSWDLGTHGSRIESRDLDGRRTMRMHVHGNGATGSSRASSRRRWGERAR